MIAGKFRLKVSCNWPQAFEILLINFVDLSVAQVRVIFNLPDKFGTFDEPLAYVEWFTPLGSILPDLGMHQISHSTRMHARRASIVPLSQIQRTVHLIPKFGREVDANWTSENVLEKCDKHRFCTIPLPRQLIVFYLLMPIMFEMPRIHGLLCLILYATYILTDSTIHYIYPD
jgi:hypothetical protein